jgi:hypothetical protein
MAAELLYKYTGGGANSNPDASLGGTGSSVTVASVAINNIFDNVYPDDIDLGNHVSYRAIDIYNDGADSALHIEFWFTDTPNVQSVVAAWYESSPGQTIASDTTEPAGASWTEYRTGNRLTLGNLAAGARHRIWIRRTVNQDADNLNNDTATLKCWFS